MPEWKRSSDKKYVKRTYKEEDYTNKYDYNEDESKQVKTYDNSDDFQNDYKMIGITDNQEEKIIPDQDDFEYDNRNQEDDENNVDEYEDNEDDLEYFEENHDYKKLIVKILLVILLIIAVILGVYFGYKNGKSKAKSNEVSTNTTVQTNTLTSSISGYKVLGKIKIEKLGIEQYILDSSSDAALDLGVGYIDNGASINNYGNFAIAGHNVEGVFMKLSDLAIGDKIILVDKKLEETTYVVTSKSTVDPSNLECLLQDENKIELTLITCQAGATERLVVKAEEEDLVSSSDTNTTISNTENVVSNSVQ